MKSPRTRSFTIFAQDPETKDKDGNILKARVDIPSEEFEEGPCGYRVSVIDYDTSTNTHYIPLDYSDMRHPYEDPFAEKSDEELLNDPQFHCQNVYVIIMRILARFEFALGRRVSWSFGGHQIKVAPHAFSDANAFYSRDDRALLFGYFQTRTKTRSLKESRSKRVFTCLSHDVIAHETTHAILDGLRERYTAPSSPEQAGFHEGFADIVALLSVFSIKEVVVSLLKNADDAPLKSSENLISITSLTKENLSRSALLGLAEEVGQELTDLRGNSLRRSIDIAKQVENKPKAFLDYDEHPEFEQPHRCGELLVAAIMNAFLEVWLTRIERLKHKSETLKYLDLHLIADQAKDAAKHLLTMCIRALDYTPPTDILFADYLTAILTSDSEAVPDDSRYKYREILVKCFAKFGIKPVTDSGIWNRAEKDYIYDQTHFDSLLRDKNEIFRFIWDNRKKLRIDENAYTKVLSVRPSLRVAPDGFIVKETVAEYIQVSMLKAEELQRLDPPIGNKLSGDLDITLYGGGTLIFDEYGRLKYHINNRLYSPRKQKKRLEYLWRYGYLANRRSFNENLFSKMHLSRSMNTSNMPHIIEEEF